jgi:hypothetical protein
VARIARARELKAKRTGLMASDPIARSEEEALACFMEQNMVRR